MRVSIIVPWRDKGDIWRQANLRYVLKHLEDSGIAPVLIAPDGGTGAQPFNRHAAYNKGMGTCPADVYVFHEADMLVSKKQLRAAIQMASATTGLVVPFDTYHYLSSEDTQQVRSGFDPAHCHPEQVMAHGRSVGAVNVVSAQTMSLVGQWDENFSGWGFDDRAMALAFSVATGYGTRFVKGVGTHLYHTPGWAAGGRFRGGSEVSDDERKATDANESRYELYRQATLPSQIRFLTTERKVA